MIAQARSWWDHLGYCWNKVHDKYRTFGIRPWRGAPFVVWLVVDHNNVATQSEKHISTCRECRTHSIPMPGKPFWVPPKRYP